MISAVLVVIHFLHLHGPSGNNISVNANSISSVNQPHAPHGHFAKHTKCILVMSNGRFIATREACRDIIRMINPDVDNGGKG